MQCVMSQKSFNKLMTREYQCPSRKVDGIKSVRKLKTTNINFAIDDYKHALDRRTEELL